MIWETIKAFSIINNCLDEDYSNVLAWLNEQLAIVWEDRGAFPGLGAMLCALEVSRRHSLPYCSRLRMPWFIWFAWASIALPACSRTL